jgi:hypothetical protein
MKTSDFKLGMRVRRRSGDGSFVKDRLRGADLKGRRIGIVISLPERVTPKQWGITVQYEGTTLSEVIPIHRLEALPLREQPIPLGGAWTPNEKTFIGNLHTLR